MTGQTEDKYFTETPNYTQVCVDCCCRGCSDPNPDTNVSPWFFGRILKHSNTILTHSSLHFFDSNPETRLTYTNETIVSSRVPTPPEKLTPLTEKKPLIVKPSHTPSPTPLPRVPLLKVSGNSYYHSLFPNKSMAQLLTHSLSLTHSLTHSFTHSPTHLLTHLFAYLERMGESHYNSCLP